MLNPRSSLQFYFRVRVAPDVAGGETAFSQVCDQLFVNLFAFITYLEPGHKGPFIFLPFDRMY